MFRIEFLKLRDCKRKSDFTGCKNKGEDAYF